MKITFVSFTIYFLKKQKHGHWCLSEKVLVAKIDLNENELVYCNKPHIYIMHVINIINMKFFDTLYISNKVTKKINC